MSQDYPNREEWLAKRTQRKVRGRLIHVSKPLVLVAKPHPHYIVSPAPGKTQKS